MAKLDILVYPDERLRQIARPVTEFNRELERLVADMTETMYSAPGIGLAAVQVNVPLRVVVMDLSEEKDSLRVFHQPGNIRACGQYRVRGGLLIGARRVRHGGARQDGEDQGLRCERARV